MLSNNRGVSYLVGTALVAGIIIVVSTTLLVTAGTTLSDSQESSEVEAAQQTMVQLDSEIGLAALEYSTTSTNFEFSQHGNHMEIRDGGTMYVHITQDEDFIDGDINAEEFADELDEDDDETALVSVFEDEDGDGYDLNQVVYDHPNHNTTIGYEGGGVWEIDENNQQTMVSPPEFHYKDRTITIPLVNVSDEGLEQGQTIGRNATISERITTAERTWPNFGETYDNDNPSVAEIEAENPVGEGVAGVTVEDSDYCEAWATFFDNRTETSVVNQCEEEDRVVAVLAVPIEQTVDGGLTIGGAVGLGGNPDVKSYNSSTNEEETGQGDIFVQDNPSFQGEAGEVSGDLYVNESFTIDGNDVRSDSAENFYSTGDITVDDNMDVSDTEEIKAGGDIIIDVNQNQFDDDIELVAGGEIDNGGWASGTEGASNIDEVQEIQETFQSFIDVEQTIDNAESSSDDWNELTDLSQTITAGEYVINGDLNEELEIDTSQGEVEIFVDGTIQSNDLEVVNGDEEVNIYTNQNVDFGNASWHSVDVSDNPSTARGEQVFLWANDTIDLQGDAEFYGVMFARQDVDPDGNPDIYGAAVADQGSVSGTPNIFYDEALEDKVIGEETAVDAKFVTFLHISASEVIIEED